MDFTFNERLKNAWNAFMKRGPSYIPDYGYSSGIRPDRTRFKTSVERSTINSIYNRIALDAASVDICHVKVDENDQFTEIIKSDLNNALTLDANIDQTGRAFIQDLVASMLDEGSIAAVVTDADINPYNSESYKILSLRVGQILEWYPTAVKVRVYNERTGKKEDIIVKKRTCAIVENPFYSVMNQTNSTLRRLVHKLNLIDRMDDESSNPSKLDLIIQLPYTIKSEARREQAKERKAEIEAQLVNSKYGIAYIDGTERITQLNRSLDNNLIQEAKDLRNDLFTELSITNEILNGTATSEVMTNYYNRTIEPILAAIVDEMKRKFLTKTARTQGQSIKFLRDPFKLIPVDKIADLGDKLTRNEILTSNEVRGLIGFKPIDTPEANELRNKNLNKQANPMTPREMDNPEDQEIEEPDFTEENQLS